MLDRDSFHSARRADVDERRRVRASICRARSIRRVSVRRADLRNCSLTGFRAGFLVCLIHCAPHSIRMTSDIFENLRLELRRGSLIIAVLAELRVEHYGYALRKGLADR